MNICVCVNIWVRRVGPSFFFFALFGCWESVGKRREQLCVGFCLFVCWKWFALFSESGVVGLVWIVFWVLFDSCADCIEEGELCRIL